MDRYLNNVTCMVYVVSGIDSDYCHTSGQCVASSLNRAARGSSQELYATACSTSHQLPQSAFTRSHGHCSTCNVFGTTPKVQFAASLLKHRFLNSRRHMRHEPNAGANELLHT